MRTLLLACALLPPALAQDFDILIVNGRVIDGAGNPWYRADVGIRGDSIAAIGNLKGRKAVLQIDAKRQVVAPGFIDIHTHSRRGIFDDPTAENYIRQGVTTLIEGQDGSSPIPLAPFLDRIAALKIAPNFAMFAGQGAIRQEAMGLVRRAPTPEEMAKMRSLTEQAMKDGALGLSTGLFYVPGNYSTTEEVIEVAKIAARYGGMHISHMRDEAADILASVRETIRIGEEGGLPTQVTHHKVIGKANWGKSEETLKLVAEARARGVDVTIDQYPYTASSTGVAALFPQWALEGGQKSVVERLGAPESRAKIKAVIVDKIENDRGGGDPKNVEIASCGFDKSLAGKNLAQITKERGKDPTFANAAETAMDLQAKGGCSAVYHAIDEQDLVRILKSPYTMIGSDGEISLPGQGVPHPRGYGTFARVLGRYVRELQAIPLEEAVRKMSNMPAQRLKLHDRGLLAPGMKADVVIFDPATVGDRAEFGKPHQLAAGFSDVIVNGKPVIRGGQKTAERPGRVLYGAGKQ